MRKEWLGAQVERLPVLDAGRHVENRPLRDVNHKNARVEAASARRQHAAHERMRGVDALDERRPATVLDGGRGRTLQRRVEDELTHVGQHKYVRVKPEHAAHVTGHERW